MITTVYTSKLSIGPLIRPLKLKLLMTNDLDILTSLCNLASIEQIEYNWENNNIDRLTKVFDSFGLCTQPPRVVIRTGEICLSRVLSAVRHDQLYKNSTTFLAVGLYCRIIEGKLTESTWCCFPHHYCPPIAFSTIYAPKVA